MIKKYIFQFRKKILQKILSIRYLYRVFKLFSSFDSSTYVMVKENIKFPFVNIGSDFDIYVEDIDNTKNNIKNYFDSLSNYKTTEIYCEKGHHQIDLHYRSQFIYKFDLYSGDFSSKIFNNSFIKDVIKSNRQKKFFFLKGFHISIPSQDMDIIVRIFELYTHPEKKHHKDVIGIYGNDYIKKLNTKIISYSKISSSALYLGY